MPPRNGSSRQQTNAAVGCGCYASSSPAPASACSQPPRNKIGLLLPGTCQAPIEIEWLRRAQFEFCEVRVQGIQQIIPFLDHDGRRHFQHCTLTTLQPLPTQMVRGGSAAAIAAAGWAMVAAL